MVIRLLDHLACRWIDIRTDRALRGLPDDYEIRRVWLEEGRSEITATTAQTALLADTLAAFLDENNAENYVTMEMFPRVDRGLKPIRLTVEWALRESQAHKATRLQEELDRLREERS